MSSITVAIDGPAGSGKSSVSKAAAARLGFRYLDTGALYRAFAWVCLELGIDTEDAEAVIEVASGFEFEIGTDPAHYFVWAGFELASGVEDQTVFHNVDVTESIRSPRVTAVVSAIARVPEVRARMVELFRGIISLAGDAGAAGIIVEGRDITTVVATDAEVRILLTAAAEARMARRSAELEGVSAQTTARQLASRDAQDSRVVDFMNAADGVITVDSTDLDFDQTVTAVVDLVRTAQGRAGVPTD